MAKDKHAHCGYCGAGFEHATWPRACSACHQLTWRNPIPVAVIVVPVGDGVLVVRRDIPPVGKLALPGGFVDHGESWQAAGAREVREEAGVEIDAAGVRHLRTVSPPDGGTVLVFGEAAPLDELPAWQANAEVSERLVVREPTELAFTLHTDVLRAWFVARSTRGR
jgi:ADP-ribose pyrophosphatase YjhB (NUDIX family)